MGVFDSFVLGFRFIHCNCVCCTMISVHKRLQPKMKEQHALSRRNKVKCACKQFSLAMKHLNRILVLGVWDTLKNMSVKHIKKMYRILVFLDAGGVLSPFRHRRKTHLPPGQGLSLLLYPRQRPQSSLLGLLELLCSWRGKSWCNCLLQERTSLLLSNDILSSWTIL